MAATLLLQKMVALATDVNFPWLINFLIGIILQDTKTEIQSTIKKNINILKATRADILHMSINIIQATDIKPVILFSTGGSWVKDSMSNLWGRKISDLTVQCHWEWSSTIMIKHEPVSGVHKVEGKINPLFVSLAQFCPLTMQLLFTDVLDKKMNGLEWAFK